MNTLNSQVTASLVTDQYETFHIGNSIFFKLSNSETETRFLEGRQFCVAGVDAGFPGVDNGKQDHQYFKPSPHSSYNGISGLKHGLAFLLSYSGGSYQ